MARNPKPCRKGWNRTRRDIGKMCTSARTVTVNGPDGVVGHLLGFSMIVSDRVPRKSIKEVS